MNQPVSPDPFWIITQGRDSLPEEELPSRVWNLPFFPFLFTLGNLSALLLWPLLDQSLASPGASFSSLTLLFPPQPLSSDPDFLVSHKDFLQTTVPPYTHRTLPLFPYPEACAIT